MSINAVSLTVMFCSGIAVATIIDLLRTIIAGLNIRAIRKFAAIIEVVAWALLGCATFYLLLIVKLGDWRAVDSLAQIAGIFCYHFVLAKIIRFIGAVFWKICSTPFIFIGHIFVGIIQKIINIFVKIIKLLRKSPLNITKSYKKRISK